MEKTKSQVLLTGLQYVGGGRGVGFLPAEMEALGVLIPDPSGGSSGLEFVCQSLCNLRQVISTPVPQLPHV